MSDIEREEFERWAASNVPDADFDLQDNKGSWPSQYQSYHLQCMWEGWQAARQAPASGEVEPVAWIRFRSYRIAADDVIEGVEVCKPHEIGDDGSPAIPVYLHPPAKVPEGCQHENTYKTGLGYIVCYECQKNWHPDDKLPTHLQHMRSNHG